MNEPSQEVQKQNTYAVQKAKNKEVYNTLFVKSMFDSIILFNA